MTNERLQEIKDRLSKATKGEWVNYHDGIWSEFEKEGLILIAEEVDFDDAEFIAHSKSDIEYLIQQVELLERKLAKAVEQRDYYISKKYDLKFSHEAVVVNKNNKELEDIK